VRPALLPSLALVMAATALGAAFGFAISRPAMAGPGKGSSFAGPGQMGGHTAPHRNFGPIPLRHIVRNWTPGDRLNRPARRLGWGGYAGWNAPIWGAPAYSGPAVVVIRNDPPEAAKPRPLTAADLPAVPGYRPVPVGAPTLYVVDGPSGVSRRPGGARIVSVGEAELLGSGVGFETDSPTAPRIIHLQAE
jgi:hypothetical protein